MPMFELSKQILIKYKDHNPNGQIYANFNTATLGYRLKKLLEKWVAQNDDTRVATYFYNPLPRKRY